MKQALEEAWTAVTAEDIESYFIHSLVDNVWEPMWQTGAHAGLIHIARFDIILK